MTWQERVELYNRLLAGLSKGVKLAALLGERGEEAAVARVERKNGQLAGQIAKVRRSIARSWGIEAGRTLADLERVSGGLQRQLRRIQREVEIAGRVARALGYLDELIEIARRIAGG